MKRLAFSVITSLFFSIASPSVSSVRYVAAQYPETVTVLQVLRDDETRACHMNASYAQKAYEEGYNRVGGLFAAMAISDSVLAKNHMDMLAEFGVVIGPDFENGITVRDTKNNLEITKNITLAGIDESFDVFAGMVKPEGNNEAITAIKEARQIKKLQLEHVSQALSSIGLFGFASRGVSEYYVCQICGAVATGSTDKCTVCGGGEYYEDLTAKWRVYVSIDRNELLDDDQKAYARRYFNAVLKGVLGEANATVSANVFGSNLYKKWGLGEQRKFTNEEKSYIAGLEDMSREWDIYASINMEKLTPEEKDYINEMHRRYGDGPVNLSARMDAGNFSEKMKKSIEFVKTLSGTELLCDVDIIFIKRRTDEQ